MVLNCTKVMLSASAACNTVVAGHYVSNTQSTSLELFGFSSGHVTDTFRSRNPTSKIHEFLLKVFCFPRLLRG